jgi:hypothetical protein
MNWIILIVENTLNFEMNKLHVPAQRDKRKSLSFKPEIESI